MDHFDNFDDFDRHFNNSDDMSAGEEEMTDDFSAQLDDFVEKEPSEPQKRPKFRRTAMSRSSASVAAAEAQPEPMQVEPEPMQVEPEPMQVEPEPMQVQPEPMQVQPEPMQVEPEPMQVEPEPMQVQPEPMQVQPEPIQVQPEPTRQQVASPTTAEEIWAAAAEKVAASPELPEEEPAELKKDIAQPDVIKQNTESPVPDVKPAQPSVSHDTKERSRSIRATAVELLQAYIDCPSKLIRSGADVNEVNQRYLSGLKYGAEWGFSTIIIPVSQELANHLYQAEHGQPLSIDKLRERRSTMLWTPQTVTGEAFMQSSFQQKINYMESRNINVDGFINAHVQGKAINCFSSFVFQGKTVCDIIMAQIPTTNPWEVFVWLPVGGINGAPSDQNLMAVSKTWYDACGALPAVLGYGAVEYFVPHGKPSHEEALEIAKGHFAVCPERVLRLTKSHCLGELADTLTKSCVWYLGWK